MKIRKLFCYQCQWYKKNNRGRKHQCTHASVLRHRKQQIRVMVHGLKERRPSISCEKARTHKKFCGPEARFFKIDSWYEKREDIK